MGYVYVGDDIPAHRIPKPQTPEVFEQLSPDPRKQKFNIPWPKCPKNKQRVSSDPASLTFSLPTPDCPAELEEISAAPPSYVRHPLCENFLL